MAAGQRLKILLSVIALVMLAVFGCEFSTTTITDDPVPLNGTSQVSALERYTTQSAVEVYAIQAHQATATALAENYQATVNASQAVLEQQRLAATQQAATAAAQARAAADAIVATATERAYQATATQQARDWEATAIAQKATATALALAFEATATQVAWEVKTTATAESVQATQAAYQAEATRQAQQQERTLAYWRNYGIPAVLLVLLGCIVALAAYALRQYARRPILYQPNNLQDDALPPPQLGTEQEDEGETPAQLVPIPPPMPSAPGLRSVRILRRLDQARRAGFLSGPLLDSLEAAWKRIGRKDKEQ